MHGKRCNITAPTVPVNDGLQCGYNSHARIAEVKFQLNSAEAGVNVVRAYAPGEVTINRQVYRDSLVLTRDRIITDCLPERFDELASSHFEALRALAPELVIFGSGRRLRFPPLSLTQPLVNAQVGLEVMDTGAACRTYNILVGEGRHVVAALLMIESA